MPVEQGGGGGGSALGLCAASPTDIATTLNSMQARMDAMEATLAQMAGGNVNAGQLSDISQQVGWVYGVTYMGIPGWTQTAAGTLIPPDGFSLSSLGIVPPTIPGVGGGGVSFGRWSNTGTADSVTNGSIGFDLTIDTEDVDADSIATLSSSIVTVAEDAWYEISASVNLFSISSMNGLFTLILTAGGVVVNYSMYFPTAAGLSSMDVPMPPVTLYLATSTTRTARLEFTNSTGATRTMRVKQLVLKKLS